MLMESTVPHVRFCLLVLESETVLTIKEALCPAQCDGLEKCTLILPPLRRWNFFWDCFVLNLHGSTVVKLRSSKVLWWLMPITKSSKSISEGTNFSALNSENRIPTEIHMHFSKNCGGWNLSEIMYTDVQKISFMCFCRKGRKDYRRD